MCVFNWSMQTTLGGHFSTAIHVGTYFGPTHGQCLKVAITLHGSDSASAGWLARLQCVIWRASVALSAPLLAAQVESKWDERLSQVFTSNTTEGCDGSSALLGHGDYKKRVVATSWCNRGCQVEECEIRDDVDMDGTTL